MATRLDGVAATVGSRRFRRSGRRLADAAVAHGEGRTSDAAAMARQYLDGVAKIRLGRDAAVCTASVARLLGRDHPLGEEAGDEAHRILSEQGRARMLTVFAEALPPPHAEAATG